MEICTILEASHTGHTRQGWLPFFCRAGMIMQGTANANGSAPARSDVATSWRGAGDSRSRGRELFGLPQLARDAFVTRERNPVHSPVTMETSMPKSITR